MLLQNILTSKLMNKTRLNTDVRRYCLIRNLRTAEKIHSSGVKELVGSEATGWASGVRHGVVPLVLRLLCCDQLLLVETDLVELVCQLLQLVRQLLALDLLSHQVLSPA